MSGLSVPHPSPEVRGDGVVLSAWVESDLPAVLEMADDQASRRWSESLRHVRTLDDARAWMAVRTGPERLDWAVRDAATGQLVGRTGLFRFHDGPVTAVIGYGVHPGHRRRGVAVAAVGAAVRYATQELRVHRIELVHAVDNLTSCSVATRSGFSYEGTERSSLDHDDGGPPHDMHRHARLATDPPPPAEAPPGRLVVPVLAGDGVRLRPWHEDDVPALARGLTDPDVVRWGGGSTATTEVDALRFLQRLRRRADEGSTVSWAVEVDGAVAGATGIRSVNRYDMHASVAYWVLPQHRGRGIATAAMRAAAMYGLGEDGLGLHRLRLQHAIGNDASCRVAEKSGFALESVQRESFLLQGTFVDEHEHVRLVGR